MRTTDDAQTESGRARPTGGPAQTVVLVIRHGESASNAGGYFGSQSDSPLTALGIAQANALAAALAGVPIHAVYSSDLSRARDTVAPVARAHGVAVQTDRRLRERDVGALTGLSFDVAKREHPEVWARMVARDPGVTPPGGENQHDVAARVRVLLDEVLTRHRGQTVVLGSHGGTIHHLVRQLLGVHDLTVPFWLSVANASISRVDLVHVAPDLVAPRLVYANRVLATEGAIIEL